MNSRSPLSALAFTLVALLGWTAVATTARADRIVVYPVTGDATDDRLGEVEDAIAATLRSAGHDVVDGTAIRPGRAVVGVPQTSDQMVDVATQNQAQWVVIADVAVMPGQYRLHVRVGYAPVRRVEELQVNVVEDEEAPRLADVLHCLIRPEGLGDDAVRLTGGEDAAQQNAADEAARLAREAAARQAAEEAARHAQEEATRHAQEEAQRQAAAEAERQRLARVAADRQHGWDSRPVYAGDAAHPWLFQLGLAGDAILSLSLGMPPPRHPATALALVPLRLGYAIPGVAGLEARGGVDLVLGGMNGVALDAGLFYLASPLTYPIYFGGGAELGAFFATTGTQAPAFLARFLATVAWRPADAPLYVEADVGISDLTSASILSFEGGVRLGYRF